MCIRWKVAGVVLAAALGTAGSAAASVVPIADCAVPISGSPGQYLVYFGYQNNGAQATIPFGDGNQIVPGIGFQGQPTVFDVGTYPRVFRATFNTNVFTSIAWELDGNAGTISSSDLAGMDCGQPLIPPAVATGTPQVGEPLVASLGTWIGVLRGGLDVVWQRSTDGGASWNSITSQAPASTGSSTYTPQDADLGALLRVEVTADGLLGPPLDPAVVDSPASQPVAAAPGQPKVADPAQVFGGAAIPGRTLIGERPTFVGASGSATYSNQWQSRTDPSDPWQDVPGATGLTFHVPDALIGSQLRFAVIVDDGPASVTGASDPTNIVGTIPTNVTPPSLSGTPQVGQPVTLDQGTWSANPAPTLSQHWQRCAAGKCHTIKGATGTTYTLTAHDSGMTVRAQVVAANTAASRGAFTNSLGPVG
jgi:hypothetical protein